VFFMIFTYFVPIGAMCYTYTRVGIELWGSKSIGECTQRQLDNIKSKRRVRTRAVANVNCICRKCGKKFPCSAIFLSQETHTIQYFIIQRLYVFEALTFSCLPYKQYNKKSLELELKIFCRSHENSRHVQRNKSLFALLFVIFRIVE
jgi:hypothetical protein